MIKKQKDRFEFHGRRSHIETINQIKSSDFSIFIREDTRLTRAGFPTKLVESISCGTPIITNINSNITDYINEDNGIVLNNIETDLNNLFILNENRLDNSQYKIDKTIFHYEKYIKCMNQFLSDLLAE